MEGGYDVDARGHAGFVEQMLDWTFAWGNLRERDGVENYGFTCILA